MSGDLKGEQLGREHCRQREKCMQNMCGKKRRGTSKELKERPLWLELNSRKSKSNEMRLEKQAPGPDLERSHKPGAEQQEM